MCTGDSPHARSRARSMQPAICRTASLSISPPLRWPRSIAKVALRSDSITPVSSWAKPSCRSWLSRCRSRPTTSTNSRSRRRRSVALSERKVRPIRRSSTMTGAHESSKCRVPASESGIVTSKISGSRFDETASMARFNAGSTDSGIPRPSGSASGWGAASPNKWRLEKRTRRCASSSSNASGA